MWLHWALFSIPINLICNMATFRKNVLTVGPHPRGRGCVQGQNMCTLLHSSFPLIWYETWPFSEKGEFWPFDRTHDRRGMEVYGHNSCYHFAACVISFNSICNITIFWKSWNFDLCPTPLVHPWGPTKAFELKCCLIYFISIALLFAYEISVKNIDNWLSF